MKLWRCIGIEELYDLIETGHVLGKVYEESEDTSYKQTLGPCRMFFKSPAIMMDDLRYMFLIEVDVPNDRILGDGFMRWKHDNFGYDFNHTHTDYYKIEEVYVKHYSLDEVKKITIFSRYWSNRICNTFEYIFDENEWDSWDESILENDPKNVIGYYAHNFKDKYIEMLGKWIENFYYGDPNDPNDLDLYRDELNGYRMAKILKKLVKLNIENRDSGDDLWRVEHQIEHGRFYVGDSKDDV